MNKKLLNILRFVSSIAIIIILFNKIGISNILEIIKTTNIYLVLLAFLFIPISYILSALNIYFLIKAIKNIKIKLSTIIKANFLIQGFSLFIPGQLGHFSWSYFLKGKKITLGESSSFVTIDLVISFIVTGILGLTGIFIFFDILRTTYFLLAILAILIIFLIALTSKNIRKLAEKLIYKIFKIKLTGFTRTFKLFFLKHKKFVLLNFLLTTLRWVATGLMSYILFLAVGFKVPIWAAILIAAITTLVSLIPIALNGLGLRESAGVYLFSLLNIPAAASGARYLIAWFLVYSLALISFLLINWHKTKNQIRNYFE